MPEPVRPRELVPSSPDAWVLELVRADGANVAELDALDGSPVPPPPLSDAQFWGGESFAQAASRPELHCSERRSQPSTLALDSTADRSPDPSDLQNRSLPSDRRSHDNGAATSSAAFTGPRSRPSPSSRSAERLPRNSVSGLPDGVGESDADRFRPSTPPESPGGVRAGDTFEWGGYWGRATAEPPPRGFKYLEKRAKQEAAALTRRLATCAHWEELEMLLATHLDAFDAIHAATLLHRLANLFSRQRADDLPQVVHPSSRLHQRAADALGVSPNAVESAAARQRSVISAAVERLLAGLPCPGGARALATATWALGKLWSCLGAPAQLDPDLQRRLLLAIKGECKTTFGPREIVTTLRGLAHLKLHLRSTLNEKPVGQKRHHGENPVSYVHFGVATSLASAAHHARDQLSAQEVSIVLWALGALNVPCPIFVDGLVLRFDSLLPTVRSGKAIAQVFVALSALQHCTKTAVRTAMRCAERFAVLLRCDLDAPDAGEAPRLVVEQDVVGGLFALGALGIRNVALLNAAGEWCERHADEMSLRGLCTVSCAFARLDHRCEAFEAAAVPRILAAALQGNVAMHDSLQGLDDDARELLTFASVHVFQPHNPGKLFWPRPEAEDGAEDEVEEDDEFEWVEVELPVDSREVVAAQALLRTAFASGGGRARNDTGSPLAGAHGGGGSRDGGADGRRSRHNSAAEGEADDAASEDVPWVREPPAAARSCDASSEDTRIDPRVRAASAAVRDCDAAAEDDAWVREARAAARDCDAAENTWISQLRARLGGAPPPTDGLRARMRRVLSADRGEEPPGSAVDSSDDDGLDGAAHARARLQRMLSPQHGPVASEPSESRVASPPPQADRPSRVEAALAQAWSQSAEDGAAAAPSAPSGSVFGGGDAWTVAAAPPPCSGCPEASEAHSPLERVEDTRFEEAQPEAVEEMSCEGPPPEGVDDTSFVGPPPDGVDDTSFEGPLLERSAGVITTVEIDPRSRRRPDLVLTLSNTCANQLAIQRVKRRQILAADALEKGGRLLTARDVAQKKKGVRCRQKVVIARSRLGTLCHEDIGHVLWALVLSGGWPTAAGGGADPACATLVLSLLLHLVWLRLAGLPIPKWVLHGGNRAFGDFVGADGITDAALERAGWRGASFNVRRVLSAGLFLGMSVPPMPAGDGAPCCVYAIGEAQATKAAQRDLARFVRKTIGGDGVAFNPVSAGGVFRLSLVVRESVARAWVEGASEPDGVGEGEGAGEGPQIAMELVPPGAAVCRATGARLGVRAWRERVLAASGVDVITIDVRVWADVRRRQTELGFLRRLLTKHLSRRPEAPAV